jgi:PTH1 family peptidyl-tRNA hydrolase
VKLIAGLGNPGSKYRGTRHNVGFEVMETLAQRHGLTFETSPVEAVVARMRAPGAAWLVKPLTFMNLSGQAVAGLARYYRIDAPDLLVIVDDVNLELGRLRARREGSEGGHNGLRSVIEHLGTTGFPRLRVGVGRGDRRRDLADHVLARFDPDERPVVEEAITRAADAAELFITGSIEQVMNEYNRKGSDEDEVQ